MNLPSSGAVLLAAIFCHGVHAQPATPAPAFDVAYRAWDVATDIARHNKNASLSGECGKTFRPFVIPGLKPQPKPEQDLAAAACYEAARSLCANDRLQRTDEITAKCREFR